MALDRDLEFLLEIGALRFKQRAWAHFYTPNFANITEHTFRVIWIAIIIAKHENNQNIDTIIKLALAHDISESRGIDVDYVSREFAERFEKEAMDATLNGTSIEHDFKKIWEEAEKKETPEAKIVKDADSLDIDLELLEQEASTGNKIRKAKQETRKHVYESKLHTETAKKLWKLIQTADPYNWIMNNTLKNMKAKK